MTVPESLQQQADLRRRRIDRHADASAQPALTVIRPPGRWPALALGELLANYRICLMLAWRTIKVRYRQTVFGAGWAIVQPLMLMIVFTIFFGLIGRMPRQGDVPFPVFFLAGIVIWHASSRLLSGATVSIVQNKALIEKIYFPRIYFPLSAAIVGFVDLFFGLLAMAGILLVFGIAPRWELVLMPVFIVVAFAAILGVGLALSALNAKYRDIAQVHPFFTQIWFFASPILYPAAFVPEPYYTWYFLNPMAFAVTGFRWIVAGLPAPPPEAWIISPLVALLLLVGGFLVFRTREPNFDDVL